MHLHLVLLCMCVSDVSLTSESALCLSFVSGVPSLCEFVGAVASGPGNQLRLRECQSQRFLVAAAAHAETHDCAESVLIGACSHDELAWYSNQERLLREASLVFSESCC